jgi:hypothetical protein
VARFKAIETDRASRQRTGRSLEFEAATRDAAIDALLSAVGSTREVAHIDPSRTLIEIASQRWTLVALSAAEPPVSPTLRRAGAKHKHVRD